MLGGALAGLGGAQLSTAFTLNWSENMTVGRGFVAVSLVIFAAWNPMKAIVGAYLFSGAIALQLQLQARGTDISQYLLAGGAVPDRHRDPGRCSAAAGPTTAPSRSAGSSDGRRGLTATPPRPPRTVQPNPTDTNPHGGEP